MAKKGLRSTILIEMPDGSTWSVPLKVILDNRLRYYVSIGEDREEIESENAQLDQDEIIDWARGNMNWEDVQEYAVKVSQTEPDYQAGWIEGKMEVR